MLVFGVSAVQLWADDLNLPTHQVKDVEVRHLNHTMKILRYLRTLPLTTRPKGSLIM
jgi:hypothetical protein